MRYYHNQHYTEFDSINMLYGIHLYYPLTSRVRFDVGYRYLTSDAKGYDEDDEQKGLSNDSDPSYVEDIFIAGLAWKLPRYIFRKHIIDFEARYKKRYFTTEQYLELDPIHAGRIDTNYLFLFSYNMLLTRNIELSLFYNFYLRDTDTTAEPNQELLSAVKDYQQNQIGIDP